MAAALQFADAAVGSEVAPPTEIDVRRSLSDTLMTLKA